MPTIEQRGEKILIICDQGTPISDATGADPHTRTCCIKALEAYCPDNCYSQGTECCAAKKFDKITMLYQVLAPEILNQKYPGMLDGTLPESPIQ